MKLNEKELHGFIANEDYESINNRVSLAVKEKCAEGYYWLGKIYQHGFGKEIDLNKAIENYQMASDMFYGDATIHLASLHYKGIGVDKDEQKSYQLAYLAADQNNAYGQLITGIRYGNTFDETIEKNIYKAFHYVNLAYNNGLQLAKKVLRTFVKDVALNNSNRGFFDSKNILQYYKDENLGTIFIIKDLFDEVDEYDLYNHAQNYIDYRRAARRGVIKAIYEMGCYYEITNVDKARLKYEICVEAKYVKAYGGYARCSEHVDYDCAIHYYEKAIENGYQEYEKNIKRLKEDGLYLCELGEMNRKKGNIDKAKEYYDRGYNTDNDDMTFYYFGLYSYEKGKSNFFFSSKTLEDQMKTFECFHRAAQANHVISQMKVAYCYFCGRGVNQDFEKAKEYFELAVENGFAKQYIELNIKEDIRWFLRKFEGNASLYAYEYINIHKKKYDFQKSISIFKKLSESNYLDSKEIYEQLVKKHQEECNEICENKMNQIKQLLKECSDLKNENIQDLILKLIK